MTDDDVPLLAAVLEHQQADDAFSALSAVTLPSTEDFGDIAVWRERVDVADTDDAFAEFTPRLAAI